MEVKKKDEIKDKTKGKTKQKIKQKIKCTLKKDEWNDLYPNSFSRKGVILVKDIGNYENKINCKDLSENMLFTEEVIIRSHEIIFLKKDGTLYDLLKDLLTNKINRDMMKMICLQE